MILKCELDYIINAAQRLLAREQDILSAERMAREHVRRFGTDTVDVAEKLHQIINLRLDIVSNLHCAIIAARSHGDNRLMTTIQSMNQIYQQDKQTIKRLYGPSGIDIKPIKSGAPT